MHMCLLHVWRPSFQRDVSCATGARDTAAPHTTPRLRVHASGKNSQKSALHSFDLENFVASWLLRIFIPTPRPACVCAPQVLILKKSDL